MINQTINRRNFLSVNAQLLGLATFGSGMFFSEKSVAQAKPKVVVVGGGFGGSTCANYLKRFDPSSNVTLIEPQKHYFTGPYSNRVIAGLNSYDTIRRGYNALAKNGIAVVHDSATNVDMDKKLLMLSSGDHIKYDKLVISTGVDLLWSAIEGYSPAAAAVIPHAWNTGEQIKLLKSQIEAMEDGGLFLVAIPQMPYKAPPAPYERVCLVADYFKKHKPKSKILLIDPNDSFDNQLHFERAWKKMYASYIERVPGEKVVALDAKNKEITTESGQHIKASVLNIVPPQSANNLCFKFGVTNKAGWCDVDAATMRSKVSSDIYVIGDACVAGDMPKSAFSASSQAKVCAASVISDIYGTKMPDVVLTSASYSFFSPKYAISTSGVYRVVDNRITRVAGGYSNKRGLKRTAFKEAKFAHGWYAALTAGAFGHHTG